MGLGALGKKNPNQTKLTDRHLCGDYQREGGEGREEGKVWVHGDERGLANGWRTHNTLLQMMYYRTKYLKSITLMNQCHSNKGNRNAFEGLLWKSPLRAV